MIKVSRDWITVGGAGGIAIVLGLIALVSRATPVAPNSVTPMAETITNPFSNLALGARASAVYDVATNKEIYSQNPTAQLPIASLAKMMLALVSVRELPSTVDPILFNERYWPPAELISYALVTSSNEAAETLATRVENVTGENIIALLNREATRLGLEQTYFLNATGLDLSDFQAGAYGSARDMVRLIVELSRRAPNVVDATSQAQPHFRSVDRGFVWAPKTNQLTESWRDIVSSKTGQTVLASGNLAMVFDRGLGQPVAAVVLGAGPTGRFRDLEKLRHATRYYFSSLTNRS